ncbi:MAG TPA: hypothetical protein VF765_37025 [Polyangiaceae bacterium]
MKRATTFVILGALVVGLVAIGAGARAREPISADRTSDRYATRSQVRATAGAPGESHAVPSMLSVEVNESLAPPVTQPEGIDWGNPYDLMLHGVKPGRTRDMRASVTP